MMKIDRSKGFFNAKKQSESKAQIDIFGEIVDDKYADSETSAISFRDALKDIGEVSDIEININSPGGSVFSGIAIYNMLKNHDAKITVNILGVAGSISSVIAMAGDKVVMPSNAFLMVHEVWSPFIGNSKEMRKFADDLEQINKSVFNSYIEKSPDIDQELLAKMMEDETWLDANQAYELGLVDEVAKASKTAAKISPEMEVQFKNMPKFKNEEPTVETPKETKQEVTVDDVMSILEEIKSDVKAIREESKKSSESDTEQPKAPNNSFARLFNM